MCRIFFILFFPLFLNFAPIFSQTNEKLISEINFDISAQKVTLNYQGHREENPTLEKLEMLFYPGFSKVFFQNTYGVLWQDSQGLVFPKIIPPSEKYLDLSRFDEDADWFFLPDKIERKSLKPVSDALKRLSHTIRGSRNKGNGSEVVCANKICLKSRVTWNLWKIDDLKDIKPKLLAKTSVLLTPFEIKIYVNEKPFNPEKDSVQKNDLLEFEIIPYVDCHVAVFLKEEEKVYLLKSASGIKTVYSNSKVKFDDTQRTEYLCCFFDEKPLDFISLEAWLKNINNFDKFYSYVNQRKGFESFPPDPSAMLYIIRFEHNK